MVDYQIIYLTGITTDPAMLWQECDRMIQTALMQIQRGIALFLIPEMKSGAPLLDWLEKWQKSIFEQRKQFFILTSDVNQQECIEFSHPDLNLVYFPSEQELMAAFPQFAPTKEEEPPVVPPLQEKQSTVRGNSQSPQGDGGVKKPILQPVADNNDYDIDPNVLAQAIYKKFEESAGQSNKTESTPVTTKPGFGTASRDSGSYRQEGTDYSWPQKNSPAHALVNERQKIEDAAIPLSESKNKTVYDIGAMVEIAGEYACCGCHLNRMFIKGDNATRCENPECPAPDTGWMLSFELF
ncbi:MAG: hypothetical protein JW795_07700 [Chitinivibrionales bacterium]|nr:hypothetical protein [Chitinivibrionales bacterium]